jgi:MOSC domain-containing protein YiiM
MRQALLSPAYEHYTKLHIGREAIVELTRLRTPCRQMDKFAAGLAQAVMVTPETGAKPVSRAGVMAVVLNRGEVRPGDKVEVELPGTRRPLRHI